jgi:hypothetical protein
MILDEKSEKLPQIGSSRISVTVIYRHIGPKLKWPILMIIDEKCPILPKTGGGSISVTASDGPIELKIK